MNSQDKYFIGSYIERLCNQGIYANEENDEITKCYYIHRIWMQFCIDTGVAVIPHMRGLVEALQKAFDYPLAVQHNDTYITLTNKNATLYFTNINNWILIAPVPTFTVPMYHSHIRREMNIPKTPESITDVIKEFDSFIPVIELLVEEKHLESQREKMHRQLMVTTAKGILDSLLNEGKIKLDSYPEIKQTYTGEFIRFSFRDSQKDDFGCRLKYLERELLERFGNQ